MKTIQLSLIVVNLAADKTYSVLLLAGGDLWQPDGKYGILVEFGSKDISASTTFQFTRLVGAPQNQTNGTNMSKTAPAVPQFPDAIVPLTISLVSIVILARNSRFNLK